MKNHTEIKSGEWFNSVSKNTGVVYASECIYGDDILDKEKHTLNTDLLGKLIERIFTLNMYDKVGDSFYYISNILPIMKPKDSAHINKVSEWLDHLDTLKETKKNLNFIRYNKE